ncbi:MAG: RNA polymerase C-22 sterol desaturase [Caeruleum heppii]|nr:MAG: RNA polymerase C-22 sterol desaturase [Caeruleum heppii]
MARKVLNSPTYVKPCVVDVAQKLLRPTNWVFMDGKDHVDYRKGLNGLFTRKALELYLPGQEEVYDTYFAKFLEKSEQNHGQPVPFMSTFRELNCAVSCRTFVGHYITDQAVKKIADDYYKITAALELVNFPIIIPFTKTYYGKKAADMVLEEFCRCATKSKVRMRAGGEPTCIMDAWIKTMLDSEQWREKVASGVKVDESTKPPMLLRLFTDFEIAQTIFTFLFAAQDASSSATTWLFQLMADRPDVLDKVREEHLQARGGDKHQRLSMDLLEKMTYTRAVVKEVLRYRPPVLMVPYLVKKPFPISDTYTCPKGSMVVPTLYPALHDPEVYPDPDSFNPDRWITGDAEKASKNWLVFGTGPHYCLGQTYAQLHFIAMIGKAALTLDWKHHTTPLSEQIKVFATIFPEDDCRLVKKIVNTPSPDRILIDVREPTEYNAGFIPTAVNIPISSQPDALFLPADEFEDRFGFHKPSPGHELVFYCKAGVRSSAAAMMALQGGYERVGEYRGSWLEWDKKERRDGEAS